MVKKKATKTTKKKSSTVTKKVPAKKKVAPKKKAKAKIKKSPFKSKLGHDPLAWITGDDASELGLTFDNIESNIDTSSNALDQILPSTPVAESTDFSEPEASEEQSNSFIEEVADVAESSNDISTQAKVDTTSDILDDGSWGLFDDDEDESPALPVTADDGSWGLFGDDDSSSDEGVAWGLFEDELGTDTDIDHDALTIYLPATFNVSQVSKVYHEFEEVISKNHDVIVDATDIETIDASGLQLLFAGRKELQKNGCKMVIKDGSKRVDLLSKSSFINELIGISG